MRIRERRGVIPKRLPEYTMRNVLCINPIHKYRTGDVGCIESPKECKNDATLPGAVEKESRLLLLGYSETLLD